MKSEEILSKQLFEPATIDPSKGEEITKPTLSYWQDAWLRIRKNVGAIIGIILLVTLIFFALVGPYMTPYDSFEQDLSRAKLPPKIPVLENISWLHLDGTIQFTKDQPRIDVYEQKGIEEYFWFGTDGLGRDLWTRTWEGTRISLFIALVAALIDMVIGVAYGGISAYYGGRVDNVMQRIVEILYGIPFLVVVILFMLILNPGILSIILAMTVVGWLGMSRVVRGQILKLKNQEFVLASKTLGAKDSKIIIKHLLPNITGVIIVNTMFTIPGAIFGEAFLSFIGLGLPAPMASLGTLIEDGFKSLQIFPHMILFPAIVISVIMIAFNLVADGLRDALDPKMRD
ncbi:oligopeptide ABC transporter permease [Chengkuizengella axinellae]|uniref:ABC transporter permease n=1 Tax=Chengkuizengella axinellae TaxID=3064388 RepID=A0ABT9IVP7_9BACL|nr:oligopeptide ABC transporter permease [Chengkuizengella sp. 2205SS18-9]MDP5273343.1 ABC transporter permease [Chengkuizengella sp. 2205SS18-9]